MRRRHRLAALAGVILLWNAAILAAPAIDAPRASALTYLAGSLVCHQRPARSFHRAGAQYPVCARCLGLYAGAALGVVAWAVTSGLKNAPRERARRLLKVRTIRAVLLGAAFPTVITVALAWTGVWDASNIVRALLALPLGAAIAAVVAAVAARDLR